MCAALIIRCKVKTLIVRSLISTLTQKGILKAANGQRALKARQHPTPLMNTHFSLGDFAEKKNEKKMLPWLLTASLLSFSLFSSHSISISLRPHS